MSKPKILIMIPCWGRPEVFKIVARNLSDFSNQVKSMVNIECLFILSQQDQYCRKLLRTINAEKGLLSSVVYYKNEPLGEKHNAGVTYAIQKMKFDYLMNLGSDDLIHPALIMLYQPLIKSETPFFGINNLFFHELATGKTFSYYTYNDEKAVGAGRMIHRSVIKRLYDEFATLYDNEFSCGLDGSSSRRIKDTLDIHDVVIDAGMFPFIVDIKSETNINEISKFEQLKNRLKYVDNAHLSYFFIALTP